MAGEKKNAFPAIRGILEILEPIVDDDVADVFGGISGKEANLSQLPAKRGEHAPQNLSFLGSALVGKGHVEITHPDTPQLSVKQVNQPAERDSDGTGKGAREDPDGLYDAPGEGVLKSETHREEA
jgi:hypothetical protein